MQDEEIKKYEKCLYEIFRRVEVIKEYVGGKKSTGYLITEVEFICLQFRKVIELIALSSLVANKEEYSKQREKFKEDWNARLIFQDLSRINPNFYPKPTKPVEKATSEGKKFFSLEPVKYGYLTMDEALKLYEKCGGILHSDNPYKGEKNVKKFREDFPKWLSKVIVLMGHHNMELADSGHMLVGVMKPKDFNRPKAYLFGKVDPLDAKPYFKTINMDRKIDLTFLDFEKNPKILKTKIAEHLKGKAEKIWVIGLSDFENSEKVDELDFKDLLIIDVDLELIGSDYKDIIDEFKMTEDKTFMPETMAFNGRLYIYSK